MPDPTNRFKRLDKINAYEKILPLAETAARTDTLNGTWIANATQKLRREHNLTPQHARGVAVKAAHVARDRAAK